MDVDADPQSAAQWWGERRLPYNLGLVGAGIGAFLAYIALVWTFEDHLNQVEITAFTVTFQALGYLAAMAVANICFSLGPLSERVLKPANLTSYRTIAYRLGFWFSVLLPFLVPGAILYVVIAST